jgi:hypothetical protein
LNNSERAFIGLITLLLGCVLGFLARTVGNYIWEWMHGLCPVTYDLAVLVALLCMGSFLGSLLVTLLGHSGGKE